MDRDREVNAETILDKIKVVESKGKKGKYQHVVNRKERLQQPSLEDPRKRNDSRDTICG